MATNWKQDLALAMILLTLTAAFALGMHDLPDDSMMFPRILTILLGLLGLYMAVGALMKREPDARLVDWPPYRKVLVQIGAIALFALILRPASYVLAGFILCLCTAFNGGYPRKGVAIVFSAGVALAVFAIFKIFLKVPLPMGFFG
jgi:hypothetical protein